MHPREFWWLADARRPQKMYGSLTENEVAELYEFVEQDGMLKEAEERKRERRNRAK